jgi:uncharacterized integral membrane protein
MRYLLNIDRILLCLLGVIWILQGINILPGSFMTGHIQWAIAGAVLIAVEGALMYASLRRAR